MKQKTKKINKTLKTRDSYLIKVPSIIEHDRGNLSFCEIKKQIPFNVKRIYWIYNVLSKEDRGKHAHKKTEQVLFCLHGLITLELDDGIRKDSVILDNPYTGIFLGKMLWHTMKNFKKDTILLVLASKYYDEKDYIRDYNNFKKLALNK